MSVSKKNALIYCEKQFGLIDGKTATALIRQSNIYEIVGVIDSSKAGKDSGEELGEARNGVPIFIDLQDALNQLDESPDYYIYGKAPLEANISDIERNIILEAMENGMNIVNGLHEFFTEDEEFINCAKLNGVNIKDVRKPPSVKDLHVFSGNINKVNIPVIAVLGTDCASGKRTTAVKLNNYLNSIGIKSVMITTGQSGLMQGAKYGISIDALISQFVIGEIENAVVKAYEIEKPDIILVEGQSSFGHPAFMSSFAILKGSMPNGIILQHPPGRKFRCDFPEMKMPYIGTEIKLIQNFSKTPVISISLNHENLSTEKLQMFIEKYEMKFKIPVTDILTDGCYKHYCGLVKKFPHLSLKNKEMKYETQPVSLKVLS